MISEHIEYRNIENPTVFYEASHLKDLQNYFFKLLTLYLKMFFH